MHRQNSSLNGHPGFQRSGFDTGENRPTQPANAAKTDVVRRAQATQESRLDQLTASCSDLNQFLRKPAG